MERSSRSAFRHLALLSLFVLTPWTIAAADSQIGRWSDAAFRWLQQNCQRCVTTKSQARLYIAKPHPNGRLRVVSADGGSRHAGLHDAVLLVDPQPGRRFGHPLHMFFIDLNVSRAHCEARAGVLLEGGDCLLEWRRPRCTRRSLPPSSPRGGSSSSSSGQPGGAAAAGGLSGCSLLYLPEVRLSGSSHHHHRSTDLLHCSELWAPCPRPRLGPTAPPCDPLATNGKGCRAALISPCLFMRTCHHAVLISGGWNKQLADEESFKNIVKVSSMLRKNGFSESNIQIFYANGLSKNEEEMYSGKLGNIYPSSLKFAFRFHLKSLCEIKHCSNTLFVYLNSPSMPDGTSILWDTNGNGEFDESEAYTVRELLSDIDSCKSKRLVLVVDQAYPGELVRAVKRHSHAFRNSLLFLPSEEEEESRRGGLVDRLTTLEPWSCLSGLRPAWSDGTRTANTTLGGLPCDAPPPPDSLPPPACQNLSTFEMIEPEQAVDVQS